MQREVGTRGLAGFDFVREAERTQILGSEKPCTTTYPTCISPQQNPKKTRRRSRLFTSRSWFAAAVRCSAAAKPLTASAASARLFLGSKAPGFFWKALVLWAVDLARASGV